MSRIPLWIDLAQGPFVIKKIEFLASVANIYRVNISLFVTLDLCFYDEEMQCLLIK